MMQIHPQARATPPVRAEIARSAEPASVVAKRYGISDETVRKWRKRGGINHGMASWSGVVLSDQTFPSGAHSSQYSHFSRVSGFVQS